MGLYDFSRALDYYAVGQIKPEPGNVGELAAIGILYDLNDRRGLKQALFQLTHVEYTRAVTSMGAKWNIREQQFGRSTEKEIGKVWEHVLRADIPGLEEEWSRIDSEVLEEIHQEHGRIVKSAMATFAR